MIALSFTAMPTADAETIWNGGNDAYGHLPETMVSDGPGHPCRHCLKNIDAGDALYVFAYRPFPELQPYAETGPVFLHQQRCERYAAEEVLPPVLTTSPNFILRGYGSNNRIVYGTGAVTDVTVSLPMRPNFCASPRLPTCMCARRATTAISAGSMDRARKKPVAERATGFS